MLQVMRVTLRGIFRDRVFHGIVVVALMFPLIPGISQLSMRQVAPLSITLALSLISFILLLLALFLGGSSLWRDLERRYSYSVLSLPITRSSFLLGKFLGLALFLLLTACVLGCVTLLVVWLVAAGDPPDRPVLWGVLMCAIGFDALKYILLVALALLLSTVSTSFFLPLFGTISLFLVGNVSQQVYDYVHSGPGQTLPVVTRNLATALYYLLPNFSAFDLKVNAIYSLPLNPSGALLTLGYALVYTALVLFLAAAIFCRREMK